jgi:hypothetical protein
MRSFTYKVPQIEEGAILFEAENFIEHNATSKYPKNF